MVSKIVANIYKILYQNIWVPLDSSRDIIRFLQVSLWLKIVSKEQNRSFYGNANKNEPRHEKTCFRGLRPGKTQTSLRSYRD